MQLLYKQKSGAVPFVSSALSALLLITARIKGPEGILLLDRFAPGMGWIQILIISLYCGIVAHLLVVKPNSKSVRLTIWSIFSIVFFTQLLAGIFISQIFLMSGTLHIPVPALIMAGPLYRNGSFFMPILFLSTIILTGPAWCSYLCYFGALDGILSSRKKKPSANGKFWKLIRYSIFFIVIATALTLRYFRVSTGSAALIGIIFGIVGVLIMILFSGYKGLMVHCTYYCPIGILSNLLGKISPFRIKINSTCTSCMKCSNDCRYGALSPSDLKKGKAGFSCTLCGDCISSCSFNSITYSFFKLSPERSRRLFIIIVAAVHASFLGIARI